MANGMRQILLLLIPAAAAILVLSEPMIRLVYQRGEFDAAQTDLVATALFWFAFSLPFNGLFLLLTRTFFSLQRPWVPTAIAGVNLAVTAVAAFALYSPFGVGGIVAATAIATAASVVAQAWSCARQLGGLELGRLAWTTLRVIARGRGAGRGRATRSGTCSTQALGRGLIAPDRLARRRPRGWARSSTRSRSPCCGSPRRIESARCCVGARPSRRNPPRWGRMQA